MLAYDSNLAPIVGQQITATRHNSATVRPRVELLLARASAGECELVVKGMVDREMGWLFDVTRNKFVADRLFVPPLPPVALRILGELADLELTYTCVPIGSGRRIGIDADLDGWLDGDDPNPR